MIALDSTVRHVLRAVNRRARVADRRLVILRGSESIDSDVDPLHACILTIAEPPSPALEIAPHAEPRARAGTPGAFEVLIEEQSDRAAIRVSGELDMATGPDLAAALAGQAAQRKSVLLDLRGVGFMDSTGIRVLIARPRRARPSERGAE